MNLAARLVTIARYRSTIVGHLLALVRMDVKQFRNDACRLLMGEIHPGCKFHRRESGRKRVWKVSETSEALIIAGLRHSSKPLIDSEHFGLRYSNSLLQCHRTGHQT